MGTIFEEGYCNNRESTKKSNQVSIPIEETARQEQTKNVKSVSVRTKKTAWRLN